jgi:hypothetical protein
LALVVSSEAQLSEEKRPLDGRVSVSAPKTSSDRRRSEPSRNQDRMIAQPTAITMQLRNLVVPSVGQHWVVSRAKRSSRPAILDEARSTSRMSGRMLTESSRDDRLEASTC